MRKRNELLNIMEAISAILVVLIHFKLPAWTGEVVTAVARVSVPFFFCISGYFFYKGDSEKELAGIPRKIKRLLSLILESETVYFLFYLILQIDNHGFTFQAIKNVIEVEICRPYLAELVNRLAIFAPPLNGTLWFVGSLAVVYVCAYCVVKCGQQKLVFIISQVFLLIGFILRRVLYYTGEDIQFPYERLLPFLPFPFFMMGYYIRKNQNLYNQINNRTYCVIFAAGILLTLIEQFAGVHTLYAGTVLLVPAMLSFCGKHHEYTAKTRAGRYLSHVGANTATYIYILHTMIGAVLGVIIPRLFSIEPQNPVYIWMNPVLVCAASVVCGEVIFVLKQLLLKNGDIYGSNKRNRPSI